MSFERTQIVIPSSSFTGTQPISIAVTSAAISSSGATHTKYGDSTSFETHDAVTFHVLFFMFLSSQVTCLGQSLAKAGLRGSIRLGPWGNRCQLWFTLRTWSARPTRSPMCHAGIRLTHPEV